MDGQNFNNESNDILNTEPTPVSEPVEANASSSVYETVNVDTGSYHYQDNTAQYTDSSYTVDEKSEGQSTPGLAIASLVMGIISLLVCCCWGCGILFAIPGMIMGISANKKVKTGVGTAGIVTSIVGLVLNIIVLIVYVVSLFIAMNA